MTDDLFTVSESRIDDLCRQAEKLIEVAHGPVQRVRVQAGDSLVEIEWPEPTAAPHGFSTGPAAAEPVAEQSSTDGLVSIDAPLVGTFYRAPSPDARPFVEVGDVLEAGRQVAIVEAMKLMNPVDADRAGRIVEVLASDGASVEYGESLFLIEPS